jgi:dihydrofolate synthase/folylpolyglutamate synthase
VSEVTSALQALADRTRFGMKPGLETIRALLARLGNPERDIAAIHIAGTNGKGAVAAMCESVLRRAGYPVARYISPHLLALNERFLIGGEPVDDVTLEKTSAEVLAAVRAIEGAGNQPVTFFECLTAVGFLLFKRLGMKVVVLETGLGGRLDATNVVTPLVSVLTRIGLDHCDWLGHTIPEIAREKAGIIKPGRPVVCGAMPEEARAVMAQTAAERGSPFILAEESVSISSSRGALDGQTLRISTQDRTLPPIRFPLAGSFQVENAVTAVAALEAVVSCGLPITDEAFTQGLSNVVWPGRFQLVAKDPPTLVDGAHNPEGAKALLGALKSCHVKQPVALVAGFCGDKDAVGHLRTLAPVIKVAWGVPIPNPRSLSPGKTEGLMRIAGIDAAGSCDTLEEAVKAATTWARENGGLVLICGSLFLAGQALALFGKASALRRDPNERLKAEAPK